MFKKSLAVLAVLGAFAGVSSAAEVTLYGRVDAGLQYQHIDQDEANVDDDDNFAMKSGFTTGSRWGMKGTEDLGNGMTVGFVLENGFNVDDGSLGDSDRLFNRESQVFVRSNFGELSFGRVGQLNSGNGTYGLTGSISPFGTTWGDYSGNSSNFMSGGARFDNTVTYKSPAFAGFTGYAQYAFKINGQTAGREGSANADRYAALALRYQGGALEGIIVADTTMYGSHRANSKHLDDGYTVTAGGNYTFDNGLKILAFGQWFDNMEINTKARAGVSLPGVEAMAGSYGFVDGFGLSLGAHYPVAGGTLKAQIAMRDMENQDGVDFTRWIAGAGYDYPLSKRTSVYAMAGYSVEKIEKKNGDEAKPNGCEATIGMVHRF